MDIVQQCVAHTQLGLGDQERSEAGHGRVVRRARGRARHDVGEVVVAQRGSQAQGEEDDPERH